MKPRLTLVHPSAARVVVHPAWARKAQARDLFNTAHAHGYCLSGRTTPRGVRLFWWRPPL